MTAQMSTCPSCGAVGNPEPGFIEDAGQSSQGYARWIPGALELGVFGGAKKMGRPRYPIETVRCTSCGLLTLYAANPS